MAVLETTEFPDCFYTSVSHYYRCHLKSLIRIDQIRLDHSPSVDPKNFWCPGDFRELVRFMLC